MPHVTGRGATAALAALLIAVPIAAARPIDANTDARLSALEAKVADLEARVAALEGSPSPNPTFSPSPTPTATPSPTSSPTPSPAPTPAPTPSPSPINQPLCQATFGAPTGSDQSAAIASFLVANAGRTVCFTTGTYRVEARITLDGWTGTILGRGATFQRQSASSTGEQIRIVQSHDVIVDGLNVRGPATLSDIRSRVFGSGDQEDEHAFTVESSANVTIRNATLTGLWGDGVYIRARNSGGVDYPSSNVTISNVAMDVIGRNCISVISVDGLLVSRVRCSNVSLHGFDGEPNRSTDVEANIRIEDSDWRAFDAGHTPSGPGYAVQIGPGYSTVQAQDVILSGNTMDLARVRIAGYDSSRPALRITVTGTRPESSGAGVFSHIRGFTFTDNGLLTASKTDVS